MSKTFAFHDHQNKSLGLVRTLRSLGWQPTGERPDLFLVDFDGPPYYQELIRRYHAQGARVLLYPHGATAQLCLDIWEPSPEVSGYLAFSRGQAETLARMGYPRPVGVTGWHWCEQRPARAIPADPGRVLFAPIHPLGNGFLHPLHEGANRSAFRNILDNFAAEAISVRLLGTAEQNGIWVEPEVEYHQAALDNTTADMDRADLVVSYGTFAYLAIARGLPTVMYGQDYPLVDGNSVEEAIAARHWQDYADLMRYPVQRVADLPGSERAVADWRDLFIGAQIDPYRLAAALELILEPAEVPA